MSHLFVLLVGAFSWRSGGAVFAFLSRHDAVAVWSRGALLRLPLLQHLLQVESPPVVHEEVLHLPHRLVADDVGDGLEVFAVFSDPWKTAEKVLRVNMTMFISKTKLIVFADK